MAFWRGRPGAFRRFCGTVDVREARLVVGLIAVQFPNKRATDAFPADGNVVEDGVTVMGQLLGVSEEGAPSWRVGPVDGLATVSAGWGWR